MDILVHTLSGAALGSVVAGYSKQGIKQRLSIVVISCFGSVFPDFPLCVFLLGFATSVVQIKTRDIDYSYSGHTDMYQEFEEKSKEQQKNILGEDLYHIMERFDNELNMHF